LFVVGIACDIDEQAARQHYDDESGSRGGKQLPEDDDSGDQRRRQPDLQWRQDKFVFAAEGKMPHAQHDDHGTDADKIQRPRGY
jgi:hypothetical protein